MITASYAFLPHIRVSVVIIFKSVGYISTPAICATRWQWPCRELCSFLLYGVSGRVGYPAD
ncbi:hypothetical protein [Symbiopectobacterium sp. RP]|uniref:hypothetical protein n=1 Tax=Symbiopectobacterium sp. RP TaxID=3248553 RepID=UPI003D2810CE